MTFETVGKIFEEKQSEKIYIHTLSERHTLTKTKRDCFDILNINVNLHYRVCAMEP